MRNCARFLRWRLNLKPAITALCLAAAAPAAIALSLGPEQKIVCPLDGTSFHGRGGGPGSYREPWRNFLGTYRGYGKTLDLMPTGATLAPWPLATCRSNRFVIYKQKFTADEIARLRPYVVSAEYQALAAEHTRYYLAALLQERLGATRAQLRYVLLMATWEARSGTFYRTYAQKALDAFQAAQVNRTQDAEGWLLDQFIAGELERRLDRYEQVSSRFRGLDNLTDVDKFGYRETLRLQLHLANARESRQCSLIEPPPLVPGQPAAKEPQYYCRDPDPSTKKADLPLPVFTGSEADILAQQARYLEENGEGADAARLYHRAARKGSVRAATRLGEIYATGIPGVPKDLQDSLKWKQRAKELAANPAAPPLRTLER